MIACKSDDSVKSLHWRQFGFHILYLAHDASGHSHGHGGHSHGHGHHSDDKHVEDGPTETNGNGRGTEDGMALSALDSRSNDDDGDIRLPSSLHLCTG